MKKVLLFLSSLVLSVLLHAIPATQGKIIRELPDGTKISTYLTGDEWSNFVTSEDGLLIAEGKDGFFYFAKMESDGYINPTSYIYKNPSDRTQEEKKIIKELKNNNFRAISKESGNKKRLLFEQQRYSVEGMQKAGVVGEKGIAILVNFKDVKFSTDSATANKNFTNLLNEKGYSVGNSIGSARDYYIASSDSIFKPTFDVYGPYDLPEDMSYYGRNSSGGDINATGMIISACKLADDAGVDFSQYDTDGNGRIDNVFVYYAGYNEAEGGPANSIWPHRFMISSSPTFDGVKLYDYACSSELKKNQGKTMAGIGTFAHEFGHVLGLPDLYNTNKSLGNIHTVGYWDLMCSGSYNADGDVPPLFSSYERFYCGWLTPEILKDCETFSIKPAVDHKSKAYMVTETDISNLKGKDPNPSFFYLLEYREKKSWDAYLPAAGMLIWRIDYNRSDWDRNQPNNYVDNDRQRVNIMEADGIGDAGTQQGDAFGNRYTSYKFEPKGSGAAWNKKVSKITQHGRDSMTFVFESAKCGAIPSGNVSMKVLYNTADKKWKVDLPSKLSFDMFIYAPDGNLVYRESNFDSKKEIDYQKFNQGIYIIKFVSGKDVLKAKAIRP